MDLTDEERALILKHRKAKRPAWTPRPLVSYTPEEKVAHFDREYAEALRLLREKETKGFVNEDEDHWAYEAGGALGKGLGAAGSLLTIAAIAVTTFTVGSMVVDKMIDDTAKSKTDMMNAGLRKDDVEQTLRAINEGRAVTPEALSRAKAYQQEMSMRMTGATEKSGEERAGDVVAMLGGGLLGSLIGGYIESALGGASVSDQGQRFRDREAGSTG